MTIFQHHFNKKVFYSCDFKVIYFCSYWLHCFVPHSESRPSHHGVVNTPKWSGFISKTQLQRYIALLLMDVPKSLQVENAQSVSL